MKQKINIGDKVETFLLNSSRKKIIIKGIVKQINNFYGNETYTITDAYLQDEFISRNVKSI